MKTIASGRGGDPIASKCVAEFASHPSEVRADPEDVLALVRVIAKWKLRKTVVVWDIFQSLASPSSRRLKKRRLESF